MLAAGDGSGTPDAKRESRSSPWVSNESVWLSRLLASSASASARSVLIGGGRMRRSSALKVPGEFGMEEGTRPGEFGMDDGAESPDRDSQSPDFRVSRGFP